MLKIPYGQSSFKVVMRDDFFYQDRSEYIRTLENYNSRFLFYLRPRRFGKSLFVSMLHHYYGLEHQSMFLNFFGKLAIGQNPTPLASQYLVLYFEFSGIQTRTEDSTYNGFYNKVRGSVGSFLKKYKTYFDESLQKEILSHPEPNEILSHLFTAHIDNHVPYPIYILIDEYDHFANELISFNYHLFSKMVSENGFVRKFYESIKTATAQNVVERVFVTGVSPITLDSLTSGFNIGRNISLDIIFHNMMGFVESEVKEILEKTNVVEDTQLEKILGDLRDWYNGYLFNIEGDPIYNPDMVLYFVQDYQYHKKYPREMLDVNIASDYGKIKNIFSIQNREEENLEVLRLLMETGEARALLTSQFSFQRVFSQDDLVSLLFYMGFLTIKSENLSDYVFKMPNYVIERLYADYFWGVLLHRAQLPFNNNPVNNALFKLAETGNPQPLFDEVELVLKTLSARDAMNFTEGALKAVFITLFHQQRFYYVHSEYETQRKYVDVFLEAIGNYKPNYEVAFELKYIKKTDNTTDVDQLLTIAQTQLRGYMESKKFKPRQNLIGFVVVVKGDEVIWKQHQGLGTMK